MDYLKNKYLIVSAVVLTVIILGAGGFLYFKFQNSQNPSVQSATEDTKKIIEEAGKLIDLPSENPTVATVTDISKLKDQPFFQKAKNGDKVLIYTGARKAILYDPNINKVLEVAPINIGSSSAQIASKIALRNGTRTAGLTRKVEAELKKSLPNINIVSKENAEKQDYDQTTVVILNDSAKELAKSLVNLLKGAKIGDLPKEEIKPVETDILIILGKDRT